MLMKSCINRLLVGQMALTFALGVVGPIRAAEEAPKAATKETPQASAKRALFVKEAEKYQPKKRDAWKELMGKRIGEIEKVIEISAEEKQRLQTAANDLVEISLPEWRTDIEAVFMKNPFIGFPDEDDDAEAVFNRGAERLAVYLQWDAPQLKLPFERAAWRDSVQSVLGPDRFSKWEAHTAERDKAALAKLHAVLEKVKVQVREQFTSNRKARLQLIARQLALSPARVAELEKCVELSVEETMNKWRTSIENQFLREDDADRTGMIRGEVSRFRYVDMSDASFSDTVLDASLTADERAELARIEEKNQARSRQLAVQMSLMEMTRMLALTKEQRKKIEGLLGIEAQSLPATKNDPSNMMFTQGAEFLAVARMLTDASLAPILDAVQVKQWKEQTGKKVDWRAAGGGLPARAPDHAEPEWAYHLVSDFSQREQGRDRAKAELAMIRLAEDAVRVLGLDATVREQLLVAAYGEVESHLNTQAEQAKSQRRVQIDGVDAADVLQNLKQSLNRYYSSNGLPTERGVWARMLPKILTSAQMTQWKAEIAEREAHTRATVAQYLVNTVGESCALTEAQRTLIEGRAIAAMVEYEKEMEGFFSGNEGPWYLHDYLRYLPIMSVPAEEFETMLGKEQWSKLKATQAYQMGTTYWGMIKQNHDQRIKNEAENAKKAEEAKKKAQEKKDKEQKDKEKKEATK